MIMQSVALQSLQLPPFQGIVQDGRSTPLQMRNFTAESYEIMKKRERKKAEKRERINAKQRTNARDLEGTHPSSCQLEFGLSEPRSLDLVLIELRAPHCVEQVAHDGCAVRLETVTLDIPASPTPVPTSALETQATNEVQNSVSTLLLGVFTTTCADYNETPSTEGQRFPCSSTRTYPLDGAHGTSIRDDDLGATPVQSAQPAVDHETYGRATPLQPGFICRDIRSLPDPIEGLGTRTSRSPSRSLSISKRVTADTHLPPATEFDEERNVPTAYPTVAAVSSYLNQMQAGIFDSWSNAEDELLFHLRNVAQLDWHGIATYFPKIRMSRVKYRYRQLSQSKVNRSSNRTY